MSVALDFSRFKTDRLLQGSAAVVATLYSADQLSLISAAGPLQAASTTVSEMVHAMWWGVLLGVLAVGILGRISRETVVSLLGPPGSVRGILRAAGAGVLLDLCSHGILMVGVRLYERGASAGQVMAFLVASPWNSLSLTFILIGLIGAAWTGLFIALSFGIALITGWAFDALVRKGRLPTNPEPITLPESSGIDLLRADLAQL